MIAFVLAQFELQNFDLRPQRKAGSVVVEVVVGHAQAIFGKGLVITGAHAQLPCARLMAVFGKLGFFDVQFRRRVLIDRSQQFKAAL